MAVPSDGTPVDAGVVQGWLKGTSAPNKKIVFLTFDDGPNDVTTPKVLDILKKHNAKGTFFVVGNQIGEAPHVLKRTVDEGNTVGLHSFNHNYKQLYPGRRANTANIMSQYEKSLAAARGVLGQDFTTTAWRYPGGHMSWKSLDGADKKLAAEGVHWVDWNAMTGDAEPKRRRPSTVSGMVRLATQPIGAGTKAVVILAHDTPGKDLTVQSLPQIIEAYREAGYTFGVMG